MKSETFLYITNSSNAPVVTEELYAMLSGIACRSITGIKVETDERDKFFNIESIRNPLHSTPRNLTTAYFKPLQMALSMPHTYFILDRMRKFNGGNFVDIFRNTFNYAPVLKKGIFKVLHYLELSQPKKILFTSTPHDIEAWLFFLVAHCQGVRSFVASNSPLPWRGVIKQIVPDSRLGYKTISRVYPALPAVPSVMTSKAVQYIEKIKGNYNSAKPTYMKAQEKKSKKLRASLRTSIKSIIEKPPISDPSLSDFIDYFTYRVLKKFRKKLLRQAVRKYTVKDIPDSNCVTLFLHYQPERTSIPEGGQYSQQDFAIQAICDALPDGWALIVKEHPSIFMIEDQKNFRSPEFYSWITQHPNVYFVGTKYTSFELIDHSQAVVTLTGTVGFESLIRKKPVIVLGDASYKAFPGVVFLGEDEYPPKDMEFLIEKAGDQLGDDRVLLEKVKQVENESFWDGSEEEALSRGTMALMTQHIIDLK